MKTPLSLRLYRLSAGLAEPAAGALLKARARRGKEEPARMAERLGRAGAERPDGPLVWLHGASVGETLSILPLLERLRAERPDITALVTSGTVTSATLLAGRLPPGAIHQYAPVDAPKAVARFLDHWRPDLAVFIESELWPNLIAAAKARGVRLALLSARMTEKSARGWGRAPKAAEALLTAFDLIMPQDPFIEERLILLGAEPRGLLNLKLIGEPLPVDDAALHEAREAAGARPVLLAASTHPGEDEIVLNAFARLPIEPLLVIVPRHPDRAEAIARLARSKGFEADRRSRAPFGRTRVYVADTLGELGLWMRLARGTFVGGSLVPGPGGHNPLEAARLGCPLISGPMVDNWREVYAALATADAYVKVQDTESLAVAFLEILRDGPRLEARAERARAFAGAQGAALDHALARLRPLLPA